MPPRFQPSPLEEMVISKIARVVLDQCVQINLWMDHWSQLLQDTPIPRAARMYVWQLQQYGRFVSNIGQQAAEERWGNTLPRPLGYLSLIKLDHLVRYACTLIATWKWQLQNWVNDIPAHFADIYTKSLIMQAPAVIGSHPSPDFSMDGIFHPKCKHLHLGRGWNISVLMVREVLKNIVVMKEVEHLYIAVSNVELTRLFRETLLFLVNLRTLWIPTYVASDDQDHDFLSILNQCCPQLKALKFTWGLSGEQTVFLGMFPNLTRVHVNFQDQVTQPEDVIFVLDTVPQLESMSLPDKLFEQVLVSCRRRYSVRKLDTCLSEPSLLERLVNHFPMVEYLSINMPDHPLTQLNNLLRLKTLLLTASKPQQVLDMDPLLTRLTSIRLEGIENVEEALSPNNFYLPHMETLSLVSCSEVDLENVWKVFPNLLRLDLISCRFVGRNPMMQLGMKDTPFRALKILDICDWTNSLDADHLHYLLSFCYDLASLTLDMVGTLDDATFQSILHYNKMERMQKMTLTSSGFTLAILPILNQFIGDELRVLNIEFYGLMEDEEVVEEKFNEYSGMKGKCLVELEAF